MSELFQVLTVGLGTYLLRVSLIALLGRVTVPEGMSDGLRLVAPAVLAGLVAQGLLVTGGQFRGVDAWHGAALISALVAWQTKSVSWTLAAGMTTVWLLTAIWG